MQLRTFVVEIMNVRLFFGELDVLLQHYSTWKRLIKATAWMIRFKQYIMLKFSGKESSYPHPSCSFLTVEDTDAASLDIVRFAQREVFPEVRNKLKDYDAFPNITHQGSSIGKCCPNALHKLKPISVRGLLRFGGRLQNSPLNVDAKHPFVLPKRHHVTDLIIRHYHLKVGHCGTQCALAATRERFWIVHGHSTVHHT